MIGNILLLIVSITTMLSYLPQTIKLFRTKHAEGISILSWILWVISSLAYFLYSIVASDDIMLMCTTALELMFCLIILVLSYIYRLKK